MSSFDLLDTVQPHGGWFAIMGIRGAKDVRQQLVATRAEADKLVTQLVKQNYNVFFGVAKYISAEGRTKENVLALKSIWVDIDCGPEKGEPDPTSGIPDGYMDQPTALAALKGFCDFVGLPLPIIVNSGRGIHAYWVLTEAVPRAQWELVARRFAQVCRAQKFYVDPAVFEAARVLRVPGTFNFKDDPPLPVSVVRDKTEALSLGDIAELIGVDLDEEESTIKKAERVKANKTELDKRREESPLYQQQKAAEVKNFSYLMRRSLEDKGCNQMKVAYLNRETLSYRQWWHALSIAAHCEDKDAAVHKLSAGHPDYNPETVEKIVASTTEAHRCETIEADSPGGCDGCPFRGRVGSPLTLAKRILTEPPPRVERPEEPEDEPEEAPQKAPGAKAPTLQIAEVDETLPMDGVTGAILHGESARHANFLLPAGYQRRLGGGVVVTDDAGAQHLVYEHDLYLVKRMVDANLGEVAVLRLVLPKDKVRTFNVPNTDMSDVIKLRTKLAFHGVACGARKRFEAIFQYLFSAFNELQYRNEAEQMRQQFGWADNDTKFIFGDREFTIDGVFHSPPSAATQDFAAHMHEKGDLAKWKEIVSLYGLPGLEPAAFGMLTAFGSLLFKFTGHSGAMVNLISPGSGTGKTTILQMANSVYGHPKELTNPSNDTEVSRVHKLGVFNNLCLTMDEITNMKALEFSNYIYCASTGKGRDRMKASANELRHNSARWQLMFLSTSNASFYEKLEEIKSNPDGERMRLFEYKIEMKNVIDVEVGKKMFDTELFNNYGFAGPIYIDWLVRNKDRAIRLLKDIQARVDSDCKITQRERFWSDVISCNMAGAIIAKKYCNLIDWNLAAIYNWAKQELNEMRSQVAPPKFNAATILSEYVDAHMPNLLVVDGGADGRSKMSPLPLLEPRGPLRLRFEPDNNRLILTSADFKQYCIKSQLNHRDIVNEFERSGAAKVKNYSMSKGYGGITTLQSRCLVLDMNNPYFSDVHIEYEKNDNRGD